MPIFEYRGVNATGKNIRGVVDAESPQLARAKLRSDGIYLTDLSEGSSQRVKSSKASGFGAVVRSRDIAIMTRQLSTLISAGIPLVESLSALVEQTEHLKLKRVVSDVREKVNEGSSLADAMRTHRRVFNNLYANMVMAGESSGTLGVVLDRLADFTEGQMKLRNRILQIMAYPSFMLLIGVTVMLFLFTFVIPKVTTIYDSIDAVLPTPTLVLITASSFLTNYWYFLPIFAALFIYTLRAYVAREEGRLKVDALLLKIPLLGSLIRMISISRFTRTLGTLLSSGVPLLSSMDIVKNVVNNRVISGVIDRARQDISEGDSVNAPLRRSGEFPPMVTHMIAVGERTGALDKMLIKVSDVYDDQVDSQIVTFTSLLEPVMIVAMAVTVGFIVLAVLLPLLELTSKLGI